MNVTLNISCYFGQVKVAFVRIPDSYISYERRSENRLVFQKEFYR